MLNLDLNFERYLAPTLVRRLYVAMLVVLGIVGGCVVAVGAIRCVRDAAGASADDDTTDPEAAKVIATEAIQKCINDAEEQSRQLTAPAERLGLDPDPKAACEKEWKRATQREVDARADAARAKVPEDIGAVIGALLACLLFGVAGRIVLEMAIVQFRISESLDRIAQHDSAPPPRATRP